MSGRTAVILCTCSGIIGERIDWARVAELLAGHPSRPLFNFNDLACGSDELEGLAQWLKEERPERLVVAACSPRDHEATFRRLLSDSGLNPWYLQMVNVREQVAWVTEDPGAATAKAARKFFNPTFAAPSPKARNPPLNTWTFTAPGTSLADAAPARCFTATSKASPTA